MKKITLGPLTFTYYYPAEDIKAYCDSRKHTHAEYGTGTLEITFDNLNEELLFWIQFPEAKHYSREDAVVGAGNEIANQIDRDILQLLLSSSD